MKRATRASFALLVMTIIWGATFSWMKTSIDAAHAQLGDPGADAATALFLCFRFALAAVVLPLILPAARKRLGELVIWRGGAWLALFVSLGFVLQMLGLRELDPATSAFLTSLYVLFVAMVSAWRERVWPKAPAWLGIGLATFGASFIGGPPQVSFGTAEVITVLCAVAFTGHIITTDIFTKKLPPMPLTTVMFVLTALVCGLLLAISLGRSELPASAIFALLGNWQFLYPALLCSLLGTVGALSILNLYQRELSPVRAAILFSLEPVWAACIALTMGQTQASFWFILGAVALLCGNIVMELAPKTTHSADAN
jgi:drug/metabolite transporter (DMT)-like permease